MWLISKKQGDHTQCVSSYMNTSSYMNSMNKTSNKVYSGLVKYAASYMNSSISMNKTFNKVYNGLVNKCCSRLFQQYHN